MSFQVGSQVYQYEVLPFGWTESPRCFCTLMETLVRALRTPAIPHSRGIAHGVVAALKARWGLLPGLEGVLHLPPLPAEGPPSVD